MKRQSKLTPRQQEQQELVQHQAQEQSVREFASPEELLRHDALHTPVPPSIAHRLKDSVGQAPRPSRGWWRRFFRS